jgi:hypothetical protein
LAEYSTDILNSLLIPLINCVLEAKNSIFYGGNLLMVDCCRCMGFNCYISTMFYRYSLSLFCDGGYDNKFG